MPTISSLNSSGFLNQHQGALTLYVSILTCDEPHTYPLYLGQGLEFNSSKLKTPD